MIHRRTTLRTLGAGAKRALESRVRVLRDKTGSMAEAVAATGLSIVIIGMIASGTIADLTVIGTSSSNAERSASLNALVGQPNLISGWDAARTPMTYHITLPSGTQLDSYLWRDKDITGTTYYATVLRSGETDVDGGLTCRSATKVAPECLYASSRVGSDVRALEPKNLVSSADKTRMASAFAPGEIIATIPLTAAPAGRWRFYFEGSTIGAEGTVKFLQGDHLLASAQVQSGTSKSHFGDLDVVAALGPVTVLSIDRGINMSKLLIYSTPN